MNVAPAPLPQPVPPGPAKPQRRGCVIAAAVFGALAMIVIATIAVVVWRFVRSPTGRQALLPAKLMSEAQRAPGTKELRGLGCVGGATALDNERLGEAIAAIESDSGASIWDPSRPRLTVGCTSGLVGTPPSCDQVAETYLRAVGGRAAGMFQVIVTKPMSLTPMCTALFDADGSPLPTSEPEPRRRGRADPTP